MDHQTIMEEYNGLNKDFRPGVEFDARAGYLRDPHNFYLVPTYYKVFLEKYLLPGKQFTEKELEVGKIAVFLSKLTNTYLRGAIRYVSDDAKQCSLKTLDFGSIELNIESKHIFHLTHVALANMPPFALHCELDRCLPITREFSKEAVQAFCNFVGYDEVRVLVRGHRGDKLLVSVTNASAPDDVASLLTITQLTSADLPARLYRTTYEWSYKRLLVGQTLQVTIQYAIADTDFYVITPADYKEYLRDMYHFTTYCRALPYLFSVNENLIGKAVGVMEFLNGPFERAVVTEIPPQGNLLKVKLIDWGREFVTDVTKVRLVTSSFLTNIPARAIYCADPNMRMWNRRLFMRIGMAMNIYVRQVGFNLDIPNIVSVTFATSNELAVHVNYSN